MIYVCICIYIYTYLCVMDNSNIERYLYQNIILTSAIFTTICKYNVNPSRKCVHCPFLCLHEYHIVIVNRYHVDFPLNVFLCINFPAWIFSITLLYSNTDRFLVALLYDIFFFYTRLRWSYNNNIKKDPFSVYLVVHPT